MPKNIRYRELRSLNFIMARKTAMAATPLMIGKVLFYDANYGWNTIVMRDDPGVLLARTSFELQDHLKFPGNSIILIPYVSTMNRSLAVRICGEGLSEKSVFFERRGD